MYALVDHAEREMDLLRWFAMACSPHWVFCSVLFPFFLTREKKKRSAHTLHVRSSLCGISSLVNRFSASLFPCVFALFGVGFLLLLLLFYMHCCCCCCCCFLLVARWFSIRVVSFGSRRLFTCSFLLPNTKNYFPFRYITYTLHGNTQYTYHNKKEKQKNQNDLAASTISRCCLIAA